MDRGKVKQLISVDEWSKLGKGRIYWNMLIWLFGEVRRMLLKVLLQGHLTLSICDAY